MGELSAYVYPGLVTVALSVAAFGASRWWYQRKLEKITQRLARLEAIRTMSDQHAQQARRQVEQLQQQLGTLPATLGAGWATHGGPQSVGSQPGDPQPVGPLPLGEATAGRATTAAAPHGFADTLPICVRPAGLVAPKPVAAETLPG